MQLALGLFIGLFVLTQSSFHVSVNKADQQEQSKDTNNKGQEQQVKVTEAVPTSPSQINLDFQSFLLEEVFFDEEREERKSVDEFLVGSCQRALKVLFRRIISPNAP